MFSKSAEFYDAIYTSMGKDYSKEAGTAYKFIQKHKRSKGNLLLDVACGTGAHAGPLSKHYKVEGLDLDSKMLSVARRKFPNIHFHKGNMIDFDLGRQYDVIVCLFSSIGYAKTKNNLLKAIKTMSRHLLPGGVLLIEPWFSPEQWNVGRVNTTQVSKPGLKIVRMSRSARKGKVSIIEFQYLIGTPKGIEHSAELHELGLFTYEEYIEAFKAAHLNLIHHTKGLDGRSLYIGKKPVK